MYHALYVITGVYSDILNEKIAIIDHYMVINSAKFCLDLQQLATRVTPCKRKCNADQYSNVLTRICEVKTIAFHWFYINTF